MPIVSALIILKMHNCTLGVRQSLQVVASLIVEAIKYHKREGTFVQTLSLTDWRGLTCY